MPRKCFKCILIYDWGFNTLLSPEYHPVGILKWYGTQSCCLILIKGFQSQSSIFYIAEPCVRLIFLTVRAHSDDAYIIVTKQDFKLVYSLMFLKQLFNL